MKRLLRFLVYASGFLALWRYLHRKQITILMLHGVAGPHPDAPWQPLWERLPRTKLDELLGVLGRWYRFLSLDEAVEIIAGRKPPVDYGLVLTFDDGYRNNVTEARPVLKAHGAPAALFVTTGLVETGRAFWIDRLDYALQHAPDAARDLRYGDLHFDLRGRDRAALITGYRELRLAIKKAARNDEEMLRTVDALTKQLEQSAGTSIDRIMRDDPYVAVARWSDLRQAVADGMTVGSHTRDHRRLAAIPREEVDVQLVESRREITERVGRECRYFAYPNGSLDDYVMERVAAAGYVAAVCSKLGLNRVGENLYALRRYPLPVVRSPVEMLIEISGILETPLVQRLKGVTA
jgi:peptidoglycan/xylan/chitin deacetylase (PgdA/CDA1 family)